MPAIPSINTIPILPTNLSQQNDFNQDEAASTHSSLNTKVHLHSESLPHPSLTPFPSLTGLRSRSKITVPQSLTVDSGVASAHLYNATAALDASPLAALQAAWAVILSTYTAAQDDVVYITLIACPASHTSHHTKEDAFVATPTRICLRTPQKWGQRTNGSVLKHLTESNALAQHRSKKLPVSAVRLDQPSRKGTVVTFKSKKCREDNDNFVNLSNELIEGEELAVSLVAWPDQAGFLKLEVLYSDLVMNETSALVMLKQLEDILVFILANPLEPIANSLIAIRSSLLSVVNETPDEPTESVSPAPRLHAQFQNAARYTPCRLALDFRWDIDSAKSNRNTKWTYEQLDHRAETFATHLNNRFGQLADEVVPICMGKRPELYVAILGILKAGAAWCPIDPSFPPRRRHDLIVRTGARVLVVAEQISMDSREDIPQGVVALDITCLPETASDRDMISSLKMGSLAYLIWTSGTTGDPKGVPIHHEAAVTSMRALQRSIPVDVTGGIVRCLQFAHFTFDVFVQDLFYTWGVGGTVISSTRDIILGSFAELAAMTNTTHVHLTPAFAASVPRARFPTLEVVTMIGEKLPQAVADDWGQDMRAFNTYGPAETAVVSTFRQFGAPGDEVQSENIGFPLTSVSAFVMHDNRPLMRQGIGELALGGLQLSKGYWNDPERSSGRFIWNEQYSRHLYMTGDLVRQLYDGSLEFLGRTDDLIKIQGIRVELSEISFSLRSCHPLVGQVEVLYLKRQDRPSKLIVAFLAAPASDKTEDSASHLLKGEEAVPIARRALLVARKTLPDYMIPNVFLVVNRIPRTSSAKTDGAVLKEIYSSVNLGAWERTLASNDNGREAPVWSPRESVLVATVAELTGTPRDSMSRVSDLRSIGIDSIAATRLAPLLNAKGFSISVADVLQCQTLDELFKMIDKSCTVYSVKWYDINAFHSEWYDKVKKEIKRSDFFVAPALPIQESLLSESMQNAGAYWSHTFLSLDAQIDIIRLHEAWMQVVSATEALRTGFIPSAVVSDSHDIGSVSNSTFMQLIYGEAAIDWTCVESSEAGLKDLAAQRAVEVAKGRQRNHFRDPLLAITVFEQPSNRLIMISVHHSLHDEASLGFILSDVSKIYQRLAQSLEHRHQLREALQLLLPTKAQIIRDEEFWSRALEGFVTTDDSNTWPDLTGKTTRSEDSAAGLISHTQALKTKYKSLQAAVLSLGASSVASFLRVAWGSVLLEYLETDRIVYAETWSNRIDDSTLTNIVGPLMAVLPVPFRAMGSAREALFAQSNFHREAIAHRSIHSGVIRKLLSCSEHQALYPAVFNFLPDLWQGSVTDSSSMWKKIDGIVGLTVEHPLALNVLQAANDILEIEISASQKVMSSAHLAILASQLDAFVEMMLRNPDMPTTQLSSGFPNNLISVTSVSFSENVKRARKQNPTDWVDHYAAVYPHWSAVQVVTALSHEECKTEGWNFAELRSAYSRVAAFLGHVGSSNRMIAVCLDRRIEAYAVILGILASGNTYLPIDEDLPRDRKAFLLQDSGAAMLFTTRCLALTFSSIPPESRVVYVDDSTYIEQMVRYHSTEMSSLLHSNDNAYLLYTSGSTGVPKGVLVGRGNLCSFIEGLSEFICPLIPGMKELPGKGKYLGLASRAFDVHIAEMFLAWRMGLAAVTAPRTLLLDNLELALRMLKITHTSFVPSLIDQAGLDPVNLPDLHYLGVGGEKMSKRVVDTWAPNTNAALVNAYGPTEMSIGCTAAEVTPESNLRNVGRPYGNSVAHVLVPGSNKYTLRGVAGELCFTGDLVANGYHNRPDAKGFADDFHGERIYRTGDIVRMMADDTLEYLRREDDQTKVRGQRLELGEITEAVRSTAIRTLRLKKVNVATIIAQHPKLSRPQLVSFVAPIHHSNKASECLDTLSSASENTIAVKIQAGCRKALPSYMVPDVVIPLSKLPLAPSSGKADTKHLKALFSNIQIADMTHHTSDHSLQLETSRRELTEAEKNVRSIVINTLAVDAADIQANTNIFRLGLDSLSAISLAIKLQKLGFVCTVSSVLRNPLVEQLALLPQKDLNQEATGDKLVQIRSRLTDLESNFRAAHSHGLGNSSIQAVKPCLPLQETLVATSLNDKTGTAYVNHMKLRLSTEIDHTCLYKAWGMVVANHDILRTCFHEFEHDILQIILEYDEARSASWEEIATADPETAFRLQQSKSATEIVSAIARKAPMRLTLFRPPSNNACSILLISMHHALYDWDSITMVLQELDLRYHSAPPPAHTPFDSMIEYVCSQDQEKSKSFWKDYLHKYHPTSILDRADTTDENTNLDIDGFPTVDRVFASPLAELEDFASSINGTLTSTVQAVFGIILAQTLKIQDLVFGVVLSGRTVPIENPHTIVAPCITTIPQRVKLHSNCSTIVDVVKEAQSGFVGSLEFQHTALRHIHRWLGAEKPLFDCLVSYIQKTDSRSSPYSNLWTELEDSMSNDFPFSVEFEADHESDRMRAHCAFSPAFGSFDRAASLLENMDLLLGALIRRENVTTEDLDIPKSVAIDSIPLPQVWDESHWSSRELKMREIAAEICGTGVEDISKGASFFSLGIDSITAIRFAQRLRQSGMEYSSADVMRHSCIAALARKIDTLPPHIKSSKSSSKWPQDDHLTQNISKIPVLSPRDTITEVYACTPLQSSMLTSTLGSDGRLYFHHHAVRLARHIDLRRLKHSWECLTVKTEILRTTFHLSNAGTSWLAAVHQESLITWSQHDVKTSFSGSLNGIAKHSVFHTDADFARPPWMTTILKTATEIVLVVSMHHSLYDGESINLLFQDLARLYEGTELPLRAPFSDAARAISKSNTDAESFWLQKIDGFENAEIFPSQEIAETSMIEIETTLKMKTGRIIQGCKDLGVTIQTVALLAYAKSLACHSGYRDVVFGHVVGGRSLAMPGSDEVIGPLFNTVPTRIIFDRTYATNSTAAIEIQQSSGDSQPYQHASLGTIQQTWRQSVGDTDAQLFDTLFVFQNSVNRVPSTDGLWTIINLEEVNVPTEYSTNFEFEQRREEIVLRVASRKISRTREQLQVWLTDFEQTLEDILEHPQRSVIAFPSSLQSLPLASGSHKSHQLLHDEIKPGSDLETIQTALSEVSGFAPENITTTASIFSLGLDSISAIRVAATCRKHGHGVSVADVLQGRSLEGICRRLRERKSKRTTEIEPQRTLISAGSRSKALILANVKDEDVENVLPCLAGQLFHLTTWLKSRRTMFEATWTYQCFKRLNIDDLKSAWRALRERHPVLRTIFVALSPKKIIQIILKHSALTDDSFKCIEAPDGSKDIPIDQIKLEAKQPFDLFSPPSQLRLIRGDSQDFVKLKLHHATYDAWTISTVIEDLAALYHGIRLPSPPPFEPFIHHTKCALHTPPEKAYWLKSLRNSQPTLLRLPGNQTSTPTQAPTPITLTLKSALASLRTLETLCRTTSTTLPTLILLAHARTLSHHTATTNPTFGLYQTGRSAPVAGVHELCYPCLNVTPVSIREALPRPVVESLQDLQADLAERVEFEQSYLQEVLEWVGQADGYGNGFAEPLFNTYVNILSYEGPRGGTSSSSDTDPLFLPYPIDDTTSTTSTAAENPLPPLPPTTIDTLELNHLSAKNLYLDVVRKTEDDRVDFSIRCDAELMDEGAVRAFAGEIVDEVGRIIVELEGERKQSEADQGKGKGKGNQKEGGEGQE